MTFHGVTDDEGYRDEEFNVGVVKEIHQQLLDQDVVDGPPELKELVELWPELLHKVKPPRNEMH